MSCNLTTRQQNALRLAFSVCLISMTAIVTGCGKTAFTLPTINKPVRAQAPTPALAQQLLGKGDTAQAANIYAQLASRELDPAQRYQYQLLATELYFDSELYRDGMRSFADLPTVPAPPELQQRRDILAAYNALAMQNPQQALRLLPNTRTLSDRILRIRSLEIQSRAHEALENPAQALKTRILLEANLAVPQSIALNHRKIRELLAGQSDGTIQQMATTPAGSVYRGWLEYELIARTQANVAPDVFAQRLGNWRSRYPEHPAATAEQLDTTVLAADTAISNNNVALLLPLSGSLRAQAEAIKNGILAARFADGGISSIRLYDTKSDTATAINQYEIAVAEGASLIVGPLNKSAVISLATNNRISVPTLSLNYIGENLPGHPNLYQFGLLPEDEARDVANYALHDELRKALVIVSETTLGQRLATAFTETYESAGGVVIDSALVAKDTYDYSAQLKKMLAINSSHSRRRALEKLLDTKLKFEPAIRNDIDVVFIAVDSEQARLLRPQLQFHHAGKIPLYSTASVFSGTPDKRSDSDLSGIKYNEIPWVLTDANSNSPLYRTLDQLAIEPSSALSRLVALGIDAWLVHKELENMRLDPLYSVDGKTGAISLAEGNRLRRRLQWAEFIEGVPEKIADPLPLTATMNTLQSGAEL